MKTTLYVDKTSRIGERKMTILWTDDKSRAKRLEGRDLRYWSRLINMEFHWVDIVEYPA